MARKNANYEKIIEDFNNGTIDRVAWTLVFDNDSGYWLYTGGGVSGVTPEERERLEAKMEAEYGAPCGYQDLVDLARAAGIPAEWC